MLETSLALSGMVIISGYDNELYNSILKDWRKEATTAMADGARERTEVLWISPNCEKEQLKLF
jgi:DNA adenine methylase